MDSREWDDRYAARESVWSVGPNLWVERYTADLPAGRALDLACGEGRNAVWLAGRGWRVLGVDFSRVALDKAAARVPADLPGAVRWRHADVLDYRPEPAAFDLVLLCYLHLVAEQRRHVLRRAAEALSAAGTLLVVGHDTDNLTHGVGGPPDPAVLFTALDVLADLADPIAAGRLRVRRAGQVRRAVPPDDRVALDAVVSLRRRDGAAPAG